MCIAFKLLATSNVVPEDVNQWIEWVLQVLDRVGKILHKVLVRLEPYLIINGISDIS